MGKNHAKVTMLIISLLLTCAAIAFKFFVAIPSALPHNSQSGNQVNWTNGLSAVLLLTPLLFLLGSRRNVFIRNKQRRRR